MKTIITLRLLAILLLPLVACANDGEWKNLLPKQSDLLDAEWRDFSEQGGPTDKGNPEVRTKIWRIDPDTGSLFCAGEPYSVLLSKKSYADFELECELRYLPKEGEVDLEKKRGNTGIFVRIDRDLPDTLFIMHQVELASGAFARVHGGRVSTDGTFYRMAEKVARRGKWVNEEHHTPGRFHSSIKQTVNATWPEPGPELPPAGQNIEHPINEWNHYRVSCIGPVIRVWLNGEPVTVLANAQALKGGIGLESEGRPFEIRTLRLREMGADPATALNEAVSSTK
ncbi:MAG: DUF1080 domain-containing protein [Blastochloris sp.]|nr:DUF1080 domain-containing protein [Blastochloris sp.]